MQEIEDVLGAAGQSAGSTSPHESIQNSSACRETAPKALIAAARLLSDGASDCSHLVEHTDQADTEKDVDSESEQGASSIEDRAPALPYTESTAAGTAEDSGSQTPRSVPCSLGDESQTVESAGKHIPSEPVRGMLHSQPSNTGSVYDAPQPSLSSMSQASAASTGLDKGGSNPLYACSSSGASTGATGGAVNPCYACSTSSASSGAALPQRQHFWQHTAHTGAAPAALSMLSFTAQSIPEAEASEVWQLLAYALELLITLSWTPSGQDT